MEEETVEWLRRSATQLPRVPSLAFVHIPLPQFKDAWNRSPANGTKAELVGCPQVDSGLFEVLRCVWHACGSVASSTACSADAEGEGRAVNGAVHFCCLLRLQGGGHYRRLLGPRPLQRL